jgi:serine/threonine-protein kinase
MAELFLAVQHFSLGVQKLVVVKRILPSRRHDRAFIDLFLREAQLAVTLAHPNVVHTLDVGEFDGTYFIVMEHVPGEDLRSILRAIRAQGTDAFPIEHALHVALGVCSGLAYVHEKRDLRGERLGIVHGDISTHNVVVSFSGDVKIVDFGIATCDTACESGSEPRRIKGKPRYMSPEQAAGDTMDARSDVFSLGIVLFELTTGRRLFPGTLRSTANGQRAPCPRPSEAVADYPPALERIVMRALEPDRANRYASAREMQAELEEFVREQGIAVSSSAAGAWMHSIFGQEIVRRQEALRDVHELFAPPPAPTEPRPTEPSIATGTEAVGAAGDSIAAQAMTATRPPRSRRVPMVAAAVGALAAVVAGFGWARHDASVRLATAAKSCREALDARPLPPESTGSLEIRSRPEGSTLWIDGVRQASESPTRLEHLVIGREVHVMLTKDGFDAQETSVTPTIEKPSRELDIELTKRPATLLVEFPPPGAVEVWVDGKRWNGDRSKIEGLAPDRDHWVALGAPGYEPRSYKVSVQPGQTKTLNVWLPKIAP